MLKIIDLFYRKRGSEGEKNDAEKRRRKIKDAKTIKTEIKKMFFI